MPIKNIVDEEFDRLTVIRFYDTHKGYARWVCRCKCGNETIALGTHLRQKNTRSCGCLQAENAAAEKTKHGWHGTRTYESWQNMIRRCEPGGRYHKKGIRVCLVWRHSFSTFLRDMGKRPDGYSLERKLPHVGYRPDNCEWIPKRANTIDTRNGRLTRRGRRKSL